MAPGEDHVTGATLYEKVAVRVPAVVDRLLEEYRVQRLASAPEYARFCYEGEGWKIHLKPDSELRIRFQAQAWNMAMCEIAAVLMDSDAELEQRLAALESASDASQRKGITGT